MRRLSRVKLNWSSAGSFWFWAAALLVLPNCTLDRSGIVTPTNLHRGTGDWTSAIFCDIERPGGRRCALPAEEAEVMRRAGAPVALVAGETSSVGALDYSPEALMNCGGLPEVVTFFGDFPKGRNVCLDCDTAIGTGVDQHASNAAVCTALCLDLFSDDDENDPPSAAALAFCTPERARLSTNFPATGCFEGACTTVATLLPAFDDPRRHPEPVDWVNLNGVSAAADGTLTRTAPTTGFSDAGASSSTSQLIAGSDAYLEFTATETLTARTAGLSSGPPPPGFITFSDIDFGILLFAGEIHVVENGSSVATFGTYAAGDRFRLKLRDNFNGTADVSYARLTASCMDGSPCSEAVFDPDPTTTSTIAYPVRVDAMFREQGGSVTEARIVRIR